MQLGQNVTEHKVTANPNGRIDLGTAGNSSQ